VQPLCSLCLCGVLVGDRQPQTHRGCYACDLTASLATTLVFRPLSTTRPVAKKQRNADSLFDLYANFPNPDLSLSCVISDCINFYVRPSGVRLAHSPYNYAFGGAWRVDFPERPRHKSVVVVSALLHLSNRIGNLKSIFLHDFSTAFTYNTLFPDDF